MLRTAMSLFGGHGVMEDFSALPRLYRDSAINELWEGPRNVLLTQIHRDMQGAREWYPAETFVADVLAGADSAVIAGFAREWSAIVAHPSLFLMNDETLAVCARLEDFCDRFFHAYQELALAEVPG